ncbi:MAG: TlpA family protein disulfide reductase [Candidatus Bathyarchaeota archaeon]|nr:TlpA family protein disulfide reductase [Candidatus Bathyarchaeota archaeon]
MVGKEEAPNFTLVDINGEQFSLSDHLGKVVLLDFFATWCGPCISEIEHLKSLYNKYSPDQLVILSISVDPNSDTVQILQNFAQQYEIAWTVARDTTNVADKYGVSPIPHLVMVDTEGYKIHDHVGLTGETTLRSEIDSLLSGTGNGDSNGDSDTGQTGPPYTLIAIIGGAVIVFLVVGIVVAGRLLGWSEPSKKRGSRKRRR